MENICGNQLKYLFMEANFRFNMKKFLFVWEHSHIRLKHAEITGDGVNDKTDLGETTSYLVRSNILVNRNNIVVILLEENIRLYNTYFC